MQLETKAKVAIGIGVAVAALLGGGVAVAAASKKKNNGQVEGHVYAFHGTLGRPIAGALVDFEIGKTTTDANGYYTTPPIAPGSYWFEFSAAGYETQRVQVTVPENHVETVDATLQTYQPPYVECPKSLIEGYGDLCVDVWDVDGQPAVYAYVKVSDWTGGPDYGHGYTDQNGRVVVRDLPFSNNIYCNPRGPGPESYYAYAWMDDTTGCNPGKTKRGSTGQAICTSSQVTDVFLECL